MVGEQEVRRRATPSENKAYRTSRGERLKALWVLVPVALVGLKSLVGAGHPSIASPDPGRETPPEDVEIPAPSGWWAHLRVLAGEFRQAAPRSAHLVPSGGEDRPGYRLYHVVLDTAQTAALATQAHAWITVNDLLDFGAELRARAGWFSPPARMPMVLMSPHSSPDEVPTRCLSATRVGAR